MEWIVIASRNQADIYTHNHRESLELIRSLPNPAGRLRNKGMQSDRPGFSRGKFKGSPPHSLAAERDAQAQVAKQFSKTLAKYLRDQWNQDHELKFKIVAEPGFLGMIKAQLGRSKVRKQISWLEKDLQNVPPAKWPKHLGLKRIPANKDIRKDLAVVAAANI